MGTVRISAFRTSPSTTFEIEADVIGQEPGNNRSLVRVYMVARNGPGGSTSSQFNNSGLQRWWNNTGQSSQHGPVSPFLPSGVPNGNERWREMYDYWLNHDGNGNAQLQFGMNVTYPPNTDADGDDYISGIWSAPRIGQAPGAPGAPTYSDIAATSVTLSWAAAPRGHADITNYNWEVWLSGGGSPVLNVTGGVFYSDNTADNGTLQSNTLHSGRVRALNGDGWGPYSGWTDFLTLPGTPGTPSVSDITPTGMKWSWAALGGNGSILEYQVRYSTDPGFGSGVTTVSAGTALSYTASGMSPGNVYYMQVRGRNASGWGAWSGTRSQTTLPATAPGISVAAGPSGQTAVVSLTPPSGSTGVTKYTVQRRVTGTTAPVTSTDTATNSLSVSGLTPGISYDWRATAWFGTYESPASGWVTLAQPNPNTSPGNYFDGSTAAKTDVTFSWTSTVNNSTSQANGVGVDGWESFVGAGVNATVRVQRVTGGRSGTYAARALIITDAAAAGITLGMISGVAGATKRAEVEEGATYVGSIYVRPSRAQRLYVEMLFFNAANVEITPRANGAEVVVSDTVGWTRLTASGMVPAGATTALVRVRDTSGTGWVAWKSGEWLDADDAMITLSSLFDWFSGDTADTPEYDYQWLGTANASPSARFENVVSPVDPLADPDCPAPPAPPALPTIEMDCIDEVGTWRRYSLVIPATEVRQWSSTLPTLILTTQTNAERQVRIRYFANPDDLPPEQATQDGWDAELILTYIPPHTEITMDGVTQNVTASVAGGAPRSANKLLYGTGGIPATWPELRCGVGYVVTMDVPLDAPAGNLDARVIVTQRM